MKDLGPAVFRMACNYAAPRAAALSVTGELDMLTGPILEDRARALLGERPELIIDLCAVTFLGSGGLHALLNTEQRARAADGRLLVVTGEQRAVRRALAIAKLEGILRLHRNPRSAVEALHVSRSA